MENFPDLKTDPPGGHELTAKDFCVKCCLPIDAGLLIVCECFICPECRTPTDVLEMGCYCEGCGRVYQ